MATIRKRSWQTKGGERTAWVADYFDGAGTRRLKTFATRKDGRRRGWSRPAGRWRAGTHTPESTSAMLGEAVELWLERAEAEGLERGTLVQYRQHRGHILELIPGETRLAKLTTARVEQLATIC